SSAPKRLGVGEIFNAGLAMDRGPPGRHQALSGPGSVGALWAMHPAAACIPPLYVRHSACAPVAAEPGVVLIGVSDEAEAAVHEIGQVAFVGLLAGPSCRHVLVRQVTLRSPLDHARD